MEIVKNSLPLRISLHFVDTHLYSKLYAQRVRGHLQIIRKTRNRKVFEHSEAKKWARTRSCNLCVVPLLLSCFGGEEGGLHLCTSSKPMERTNERSAFQAFKSRCRIFSINCLNPWQFEAGNANKMKLSICLLLPFFPSFYWQKLQMLFRGRRQLLVYTSLVLSHPQGQNTMRHNDHRQCQPQFIH